MSRPILYLMLAISILFVAGGFAMVVAGAEGGWPGLLFFGMCAVVFIGQLWPGIMRRNPLRPEDLLAKFPGPVELRIDRRKLLLLTIGGAIFSGVLVWMLLHEPVGTWRAILLWPCAGLIGLSVPVLLFMLVRGGALRLTSQGLELRHGWSTRVMAWDDLGLFAVRNVPPSFTPLVVYDDATQKGGRLAGANAALVGKNSALPDTYGMAHEDLAAALNAWRRQALAAAAKAPDRTGLRPKR